MQHQTEPFVDQQPSLPSARQAPATRRCSTASPPPWRDFVAYLRPGAALASIIARRDRFIATRDGFHGKKGLAGAVTGSGNTVVNSGGNLTAYQIVQNSLTISGTAKVKSHGSQS